MANTCFPIWLVISAFFVVSVCLVFPHSTTALHGSGTEEGGGGSVPVPFPAKHGTVVPKDQRWSVVSTDSGEISTMKVSDGRDGFYHLQFITMEPNSLFLPVHLHSDMVFYVNSGSGTLSWVDLVKDSDKLRQVSLRTGDVYRLRTGSFFYFQSNLESERRKLRIYAIFSDSKEEIREGSSFGAYSSVADLVLGFDNKVLQAAFNVDEEVIQELKSGERQPMIVHGVSKVEDFLNVHYRIIRDFLVRMESDMIDVSKIKNKNKADKAYNILEAKHDVENCNGWSLIVTSKQWDALKDSDFGIFLVNLTKGAMMGPHWNPLTGEIAVVLSGRGMVHVVCPSTADETECKNSRFRVREGDVFVVPRYHPMAQISFNNESFVFLGFTTTQKKNHPQYLVGSASVFQVLDKRVLAASLGVSNTTMDEILSAQREAIILECTSCAEEEERLLEEEIQRQKEEEAREREEEERKKEEEEEAKRREEEARREEEEARKREEEAAREQGAKRRQEEEEARRQEEEARREEEEAQRREEEAAREQEAKRRQEEEEARREEEGARRREEEAAREQEGRRRRQEEDARRQEEEARREQEEARKREEEEAARQEEDQEARRREEEAKRQQQEESRRREEAAARQQQEQEEEEATKRRQKEEAAARQQEEEARRWEEEAERQHKEQAMEAARRRQQEEEARRHHEEVARQRREQEKEADMRRRQEADQRQAEEETARRQREEVARQVEKAGRGWQEDEEARTRQEQEEQAVRHRQEEETTAGQLEEEVKRRQAEATKMQQEVEDEIERKQQGFQVEAATS